MGRVGMRVMLGESIDNMINAVNGSLTLYSGIGNIHTVNERTSVKAHIAAVRWFSMFVRNMDEADLP